MSPGVEVVKMGRLDREESKQQAVLALLEMIPPGLSEAGAPEDLTHAVVLAADEIVKAALERRLAERAIAKAMAPCSLSLRWGWSVRSEG